MQDEEGGFLESDAGSEPPAPMEQEKVVAQAPSGGSKSLACTLHAHVCRLLHSLDCLRPRLIFPTLQRNDSPFSILPQFLTVLGKKVDSSTMQLVPKPHC